MKSRNNPTRKAKADRRQRDSAQPVADRQKAAQIRQLAFASVLLSTASFVISFFGCIPGIVFGHMVRRACRKDPRLPGRGLALAGLVIGYVMLVANLVAIVWLLVTLAAMEPVVDPFEQVRGN